MRLVARRSYAKTTGARGPMNKGELTRTQHNAVLYIILASVGFEPTADFRVARPQFADEAFGVANNYPDTGKQDMKLTKTLRLEVEKAIPQDYVWKAL